MKIDRLLLLTIVTTALSAAATFGIGYAMGVFGGFYEDASIGPLPLWAVFLALIALQLAVCFGTLRRSLAERKRV